MKRLHGLVVIAGLLASVAGASGQDTDDGSVSPYFDCPYVDYFDTDCSQLRQRESHAPVPGHRTPAEEGPALSQQGETDETENGEATRRGILPEELILFPRESLAPDAPPLFRTLLANPTIENARRYVRWHARRTAQLQMVQALIRQAGKELERDPSVMAQVGGQP